MPIGIGAAALIGGGLLGSAALSSNASKQAGKTVSGATDRAADLQNQQFQQLLRLQMPSYNRAEGAAGVYGQALGLPQMGATGYGGQPQPGGNVPGAQPGMMTGGGGAGWEARMARGGGLTSGMTGETQYLGGEVGIGQGGAPAPVQVPAGGQPAQPQLSIADQVRNTPGYQAQLDQGIKAIDRAAPLVGGMYSGRRMKALEGHGQQTFGSYYNDWMNRVGGIAGQAPQIASNVGQAGMQNAQNMGNLWMTGANARAQGQQNSAAAWTGAVGTGIGLYGGSQGWFGR